MKKIKMVEVEDTWETGRHRSMVEVVEVDDARWQMRADSHRSMVEVVQVDDARRQMRADSHRSMVEVVQVDDASGHTRG